MDDLCVDCKDVQARMEPRVVEQNSLAFVKSKAAAGPMQVQHPQNELFCRVAMAQESVQYCVSTFHGCHFDSHAAGLHGVLLCFATSSGSAVKPGANG